MGHQPTEMGRAASQGELLATAERAWGMQLEEDGGSPRGSKSRKPGGSAMKGETDGRLMERYADGDADAFAELFVRYERRAYRSMRRSSVSPFIADPPGLRDFPPRGDPPSSSTCIPHARSPAPGSPPL